MFRKNKKKGKFITRREFPGLLMKQGEAKFKGIVSTGVSINDVNFHDDDFTLIATGDSSSDRTGNEIQVTGMWGRVTFSNSIDGTNGTNKAYYGRVLVYTARENSAPNPDVSPTELLDKDQYIVWYDRVVPIPWQNQIGNAMLTIRLKFNPYMKLRFDTGVGTTCIQNRLRFAISTDAANPKLVEVKYAIRLFYRDL